MTRKAVVSAVVILLVVGTLAVVGFIPRPEKKTEEKPVAPVNVVVEEVKPVAELPDTIELMGVVDANQVVHVSGEVAGIADEVKVKDGDACKAGDLLVALNDEMIRTDVARTEADLKNNKAQCERIEMLFKEGATTKKEHDDTCARVDMSQSAFDAAQARLKRTKIYAPADGVINKVLIKQGEYVESGVPVAEIVDVNTVKVCVDLPELDVPFFKTGAPAAVLVGPDKKTEQQGSVSYISSLADEQTRSTRLEITVDNRARALHTGEIVAVRLTRRVIKDAIMIPLLAVIPLEKSYEVFVVEDGKAQPRMIVLAPMFKEMRIQVESGLKAGDRLIISGHRQVAPGQRVNVVSPPTAEPAVARHSEQAGKP